jgi:hypothetical protein
MNWRYFSLDELVKEDLHLAVDKNARGIEELFVKPVAFAPTAELILGRYKARYNKNTELNNEH